MAKSDSIIGCNALLREAEHRSALAFTKWTEANVRFQGLLERPDDLPAPSQLAMEAARDQACAAYEALLDMQRLKYDYRKKLKALQAAHLERAKRSFPPRKKPGENA